MKNHYTNKFTFTWDIEKLVESELSKRGLTDVLKYYANCGIEYDIDIMNMYNDTHNITGIIEFLVEDAIELYEGR